MYKKCKSDIALVLKTTVKYSIAKYYLKNLQKLSKADKSQQANIVIKVETKINWSLVLYSVQYNYMIVNASSEKVVDKCII